MASNKTGKNNFPIILSAFFILFRSLSGVFIPGLDLAITQCRYIHVDIHWSATYLAVLNVVLLARRCVCEDRYCLTAVRAANDDFLKLVH